MRKLLFYFIEPYVMEWIELIRMLFESKPSDFSEPQLLELKHFPFKGYRYMMWCGRMIYRADNRDKITAQAGTPDFRRSLTHETIHLRQAQLCGSWARYYWRYGVEWLRGNPIVHPSSSAYYTIPYEMEAYANEDNPQYAAEYTGEYLDRYRIKKRKRAFKKYGNAKAWKAYLKSISIKQ